MKIVQREIGDVAVLDLSGKIMGGHDYDVFLATLELLLRRGQRKVLINLENVSWINSTGIGILIAGFKTVQEGGGRLKLVKLSPRVDSLLAVTKLSTIFESFQQEDEAVKSFV